MHISRWLVLSILLFLPNLLFGQQSPAENRALPDTLRVMTFNVLYATPDEATIQAIKSTKADIVGVQEISEPRLNYLARELDYYYHHNGNHEASYENDTGILSRYPISRATKYGATIYLNVDYPIHIYNVHLSASPYEPYDLRDGKIDEAEAVQQARFHRFPQIQPVLKDMKEELKAGAPVFLTGDFNEPSHLDWTRKAASKGMHGGKSVQWPISFELARQGLKDAYRTVYPDEVNHPGFTWTTLQGDPDEVHDRIDYVYYSGDGIKPVDASLAGISSEETDITIDGYPSDHRAVVATFILKK